MGVESRERVGPVVEGIGILRRLWEEERVIHEGKYHQFSDVEMLPKPRQQLLPIYLAANPKPGQANEAAVDRILRRVARHADGWQTDGMPVGTFRERFYRIRGYAAEVGRDPSRLESCLHLYVNISDNQEQAYREAEAFLTEYYGAGVISSDRAQVWLACGSPQAVIDKISSYIEAGRTMPVMRFVSSDLEGQLQRCMGEVMPALKPQVAAQA